MNNIDLVLTTLETLYDLKREGREKDLIRGMMLLLEQEKHDRSRHGSSDQRDTYERINHITQGV